MQMAFFMLTKCGLYEKI
jgi:hypothetical protein